MTRPPRRAQHVAIDHLVLPAGTVGTRRVRAAIERKLARLLAEQPAQVGAAMPAAKVQVKGGADAEAIAAAVAATVHRRLTR